MASTGDIRSVTSKAMAGRWVRPSFAAILPVLVLTALLVVIWYTAPNFYRINNLVNVLLQASILGLLAIGMAVVLITGGIDLSMPTSMALSAVLGAMAMKATGSPILGAAVMLGVGMAIGALNAIAVARLKMIPFVVTLSSMMLASGASVWMTRSVSISGLPPGFREFFMARPLGLPVGVWIMVAATLLMAILLQSSRQGKWLRAVGLNANAARVAGIPVERVVAQAYLFAGFMAGVTAIVLTARLGAASATMGSDALTLDTIAACVIGGVSIYGGVGKIHSAVFGAIVITILSNAMNLAGVSFYIGLIIKGVVIIAFVALERYRQGGKV